MALQRLRPPRPPSIVGHAACAPPRAAAASGDADARPSCTGNAVAGGSWAARGASACAEALASSASGQRDPPRGSAGAAEAPEATAATSRRPKRLPRPRRCARKREAAFVAVLRPVFVFGMAVWTVHADNSLAWSYPVHCSGKAAGSSRSSGTTPFPQQCARGEWRYIAPSPCAACGDQALVLPNNDLFGRQQGRGRPGSRRAAGEPYAPSP